MGWLIAVSIPAALLGFLWLVGFFTPVPAGLMLGPSYLPGFDSPSKPKMTLAPPFCSVCGHEVNLESLNTYEDHAGRWYHGECVLLMALIAPETPTIEQPERV